jgi:hypothetical protein
MERSGVENEADREDLIVRPTVICEVCRTATT